MKARIQTLILTVLASLFIVACGEKKSTSPMAETASATETNTNESVSNIGGEIDAPTNVSKKVTPDSANMSYAEKAKKDLEAQLAIFSAKEKKEKGAEYARFNDNKHGFKKSSFSVEPQGGGNLFITSKLRPGTSDAKYYANDQITVVRYYFRINAITFKEFSNAEGFLKDWAANPKGSKKPFFGEKIHGGVTEESIVRISAERAKYIAEVKRLYKNK